MSDVIPQRKPGRLSGSALTAIATRTKTAMMGSPTSGQGRANWPAGDAADAAGPSGTASGGPFTQLSKGLTRHTGTGGPEYRGWCAEREPLATFAVRPGRADTRSRVFGSRPAPTGFERVGGPCRR